MIASGRPPIRTSTLAMPSTVRSWSAGTIIGPGDGALPGAGCGKAVDRAVWKVTLPSTFCIDLVDVAVEHGDRAEALQQAERLLPIIGAPAPFGIDRPERDMGEDDDRRRVGLALEIVGEPGELLGAEIAETAGLQVDDVDEADEMDAVLVEAVPAGALGALAVAVEIGLAVPSSMKSCSPGT